LTARFTRHKVRKQIGLGRYTTKLNSTIPIAHNKVRTGDNMPVVDTSIGTCDAHAISKSNRDYEKTLIHEHDFVSVVVQKGIIRCLSCDAYFCEICGKKLDGQLIHTDRLYVEMQKQKTDASNKAAFETPTKRNIKTRPKCVND
jgi:hypothetical protein